MSFYGMLQYRNYVVRSCLVVRAFCNSSTSSSSSNIVENDSYSPAMMSDVLNYMAPSPKQTILDMTFGVGGHSKKILEACPDITLLTLDRDPMSYNCAIRLCKKYPYAVRPLLGRFSDLHQLLKTRNVQRNSIDTIFCHFGCSSLQVDIPGRGFTISSSGYLDMRMDGNRVENMLTAGDVVRHASGDDLYKIIKYYGQENNAKKIAMAILEARYLYKNLNTTGELADLITSVCGTSESVDDLDRQSNIHAKKTMYGLRAFVNNELNEMNYGLLLARLYLKLGGKIITITTNTLEDTIVKRHLSGNMIENTPNALPLKYYSDTMEGNDIIINDSLKSNWDVLTKHVILPTLAEVENNPRIKSAKFRAAVRVK